MSDSTARAFEHSFEAWWNPRCNLPKYANVPSAIAREIWQSSELHASRTSTIKELSGEGARELVEKIRALMPEDDGYYQMLDDEATALIEAWGEEKTRALRSALHGILDIVTGHDPKQPPSLYGVEEAVRAALKDSPPLTVEEK